ncbi:DUF3089 domain-containing protein [Sediminibacterium sp. TEGAF015]|uniref:DUF3089 domain-containing protein n=1 Tax=Sediminibacterium sp. TEGAF015 TaxID=575378 RepID=UPI002208EEB7|nr:DUF3089 domain-containing protein [Sediminibacterium sp. TEGAF015]BDQ12937.1 hypothetical protein TEGAF0_21540 [Sediminibacterium sp. TEGAF015]
MARSYEERDPANLPDYRDLYYWAAHPDKKDPADSTPKPLKSTAVTDTTVDVFFIHPTTYTDSEMPFGYSAPIYNNELNAKTDYSTILFQASAFNQAGKIYAPRYRQANLQAYFPKNTADSMAAIAAFELAYQDIKAAFVYYLNHYNGGKPIIIAAHSQGTTHGKRLVKEFFDNQPLQKKLVAAYLIGIPVSENEYSQIQSCKTSSQTGCIVSWRTYKTGYTPPLILKEENKAIVTNPLTWNEEPAVADAGLNKGGILLNFNKIVPAVASAKIEGNVLWTNKPRFFGNIFYTTKNYHVGDINLYYLNIRENLKQRTSSYFKK